MLFLAQNNIDNLPWPARPPDLSPIEHLWDEMDRRVHRRQPPPQSTQQLRNALLKEWNNIPQGLIQLLIGSMRRWCQTVVNARGGHTRY